MMNFNYSVFTKKQANLLFAAIKRGELRMSKQEINRMYDLVNMNTLSQEYAIFRGHCERAINHFLNGRVELAQCELNGHVTAYECVKREAYLRPYDEDNDWFEEPNANGMVEDYKEVYEWVIK